MAQPQKWGEIFQNLGNRILGVNGIFSRKIDNVGHGPDVWLRGVVQKLTTSNRTLFKTSLVAGLAGLAGFGLWRAHQNKEADKMDAKAEELRNETKMINGAVEAAAGTQWRSMVEQEQERGTSGGPLL